jgi:hypothetical protein
VLEYLERLYLSASGDDICFDAIQVLCEHRRQGYVQRALEILTLLCDRERRNLVLTVRPLDESTDPVRLRGLYATYGFVAVEGTENEMRRPFRAT